MKKFLAISLYVSLVGSCGRSIGDYREKMNADESAGSANESFTFEVLSPSENFVSPTLKEKFLNLEQMMKRRLSAMVNSLKDNKKELKIIYEKVDFRSKIKESYENSKVKLSILCGFDLDSRKIVKGINLDFSEISEELKREKEIKEMDKKAEISVMEIIFSTLDVDFINFLEERGFFEEFFLGEDSSTEICNLFDTSDLSSEIEKITIENPYQLLKEHIKRIWNLDIEEDKDNISEYTSTGKSIKNIVEIFEKFKGIDKRTFLKRNGEWETL